MIRSLPLLALALPLLVARPAVAQEVAPPGRQVIEADGFLAEVTYTSRSVRVRLFDLDGEALDLRGIWLRRCTIDIVAAHGGGEVTASRRPTLVEPRTGAPYLEVRHDLGALDDQDRLSVSLHLKNVGGTGDRTVRGAAEWARVERGVCGCSAGVECRGARCPLCSRRLCRPRR